METTQLEFPAIIPAHEVSKKMLVEQGKVRRWVDSKTVKGYRINKRLYVDIESLKKMLQECEV